MNDLEKVQRMADLNWKPASQYWHELYLKSQAEIETEDSRTGEVSG